MTSVKRCSSLHHTKSMLLLGAKAKIKDWKIHEEIRSPMKESSESTQKCSGLLYWSVRLSTWKTELLYCHYHTALDITDMSQLCLSVHVVKSPQLNSWAILSVHGVSIFSLKQVWDHSSQVFLPWWAKLSYTVSPFPQAKSTVGDSHHSVAGIWEFLFCKNEKQL